MKVLVATSRTQGYRRNDFGGCAEGELAWIPAMCEDGELDPDRPCACGRVFTGLASWAATTTVRVAEVSLTRDEYVAAIRGAFEEHGWLECPELIGDSLLWLVAYSRWPVDTVLERRLDDIVVRGVGWPGLAGLP
ncbi:hypothetical protein D5S17_26245 [Pseudonocardiaceae bacterium YIM PH 21723]|nr:hypothetical protein D5S17_26245 [Pseudonocardiaceae bacterium YIM PH 21723]